MEVKLQWITPNAEEQVVFMARVSNPSNQDNMETAGKLLTYLKKNKHWSPFEMAYACFYIECTRDISRQILRHKSNAYQEFSGRYAEYPDASFMVSEVRLQDTKNRQNSLETDDKELARWWEESQKNVLNLCSHIYKNALNYGIAKELARKVLPEGLTTSRMYMAGSLRSWYHYCEVRRHPSTQKEHRQVADAIHAILSKECPRIFEE